MGCSPSHALIINSGSRAVHTTTDDAIGLQPRIYMVSESTLRILQDVGELRIYQQEDKDPGVARVRFGTATLDQLENPVRYQTHLRRQSSLALDDFDPETLPMESAADSRTRRIEISDLEEEEEEEEEEVEEENEAEEQEDGSRASNGRDSSSSVAVIVAQVHSQRSSPENARLTGEFRVIKLDGEITVQGVVCPKDATELSQMESALIRSQELSEEQRFESLVSAEAVVVPVAIQGAVENTLQMDSDLNEEEEGTKEFLVICHTDPLSKNENDKMEGIKDQGISEGNTIEQGEPIIKDSETQQEYLLS